MLGIEVGGQPRSKVQCMLVYHFQRVKFGKDLLGRLSEIAPWLARTNAISVHRCNDLIGCLPEDWIAWIDGTKTLPIRGRLGRLLLSI